MADRHVNTFTHKLMILNDPRNVEIEFVTKVKGLWLSGNASLDEVLRVTIDFMDHIGRLDIPTYDQVFVAEMLRYLLDNQLKNGMTILHGGNRCLSEIHHN